MTIKEAEARTGLARANIRYYEEQGFFTPERGENGYRNYTGRDVDMLLKVKLLRQLGFSLEDIHDLQRGDRDLGSALELREAGLEKEQRELDRAAALCRELREDGVEFATLNAQLYLDRLVQGEEIIREDRAPRRVFPWRRWFARGLDQGIWSTLLALCGPLSLEMAILGKRGNTKGGLVLGLLALLLAAAGETFFLHRFGTTPGKALFGLRIVREDGTHLSLGEAARRSFTVAGLLILLDLSMLLPEPLNLVVGAGVGALFYGWMYWNVTHEFPLPWEWEGQVYLDGSTKETSFWDRKGSWMRVAGYIVLVLVLSAVTAAAQWQAAKPPHRGGALTVEEFVDNYNYLEQYEQGKVSLPRLAEDGGYLRRIGRQYGWHFPVEDAPPPSFRFIQKDGVVTGVTIFREWESEDTYDFIKHDTRVEVLPGEQLRVSMLALGIDRYYADAVSQAVIDAEGNYHQDYDGFRVDCETEFSGYRLYFEDRIEENVLGGLEGENQSYFVAFSISLT